VRAWQYADDLHCNIGLPNSEVAEQFLSEADRVPRLFPATCVISTDTDPRVGAACDFSSQGLHEDGKLQHLDVSFRSIGVSGAVSCSRIVLSSPHLTELDVSYNGIGDHGLLCLLKAVAQAGELTHLDIANNGITDAGCAHLAQYLHGEYCVPLAALPEKKSYSMKPEKNKNLLASTVQIVKHSKPQLHDLGLAGNKITRKGLATITKSLLSTAQEMTVDQKVIHKVALAQKSAQRQRMMMAMMMGMKMGAGGGMQCSVDELNSMGMDEMRQMMARMGGGITLDSPPLLPYMDI